ncbi:MAG: hypothetical protein HC819_22585 [Cyclobacteriaceae bacterium]|nr:hypothetical protein [Cyclobacteriaceae bacterium]
MAPAASGQSTELSGSIVDKTSQEPIPFANIAIKDIYKGTASNILGEFTLKVDSLPIVLVISHLSYEPLELEVNSSEPLRVEMTPGKLLMPELVIKGKGNDEFAYNLVNHAYNKILGKSNTDKYGKAFYRQISKNGDEYSELYEIFYDTRFTNNGVEDWAIQEGRYALKLSTADSFIYNKNFTLMVRLLTIIQPKTDDLIMPVSLDVRDQYYLSVGRILSVNNRNVAQIRFEKKENVTKPAMEGELLIDIDSHEVLKLTGTITDDNLNFITLKGKYSSWENYQVSCEIAFKEMDDDQLVLDYMRLGQTFDYFLNDEYVSKVETKSNLTYFEYYDPPQRKKLGGRMLRYGLRDSDILDNIGYNQWFWDENIILKRTPIESEVISSFEKERAFGSIYLNNKNQIELEDYKLDSDPFIVLVRRRLNEYHQPEVNKKLYLHRDKPFYVAGETMWYKVYSLQIANNIPDDKTETIFLELRDPKGEVVLSSNVASSLGRAAGSLYLPATLPPAKYTLVAGTKDMTSDFYYSESLEIFSNQTRNRQFTVAQQDTVNRFVYHPEGGRLVESLPNQLGFEASNPFGQPLEVRGRLVDGIGRMVGNLKSEYNGFGSIFVMPRQEVGFNTLIMSDIFEETAFPEIHEDGYSCMVNNLKPHTIDVTVNSTIKFEGKKFYLLVVADGVLYDRRIGIITRGLYRAEFPKAPLPNGVSQLLLLDEHGILHCRRLVYVQQSDATFIKYYLAKKDFKPRERIELVLEIKDQNGKAVANTDLSVSVLNYDRISRDPLARNIQNYINLGYLTGKKLEKPGELFEEYDRETSKMLDLVMLNQETAIPQFQLLDSIFAKPLEHKPNKPNENHQSNLVQVDLPAYAVQYLENYRPQTMGADRTAGHSSEIDETPQAFPSPNYGKSDDGPPDYRTTLYWTPQISTNRKGRVKISFFNSDDARNYQVIVEGLSQHGLPVFNTFTFGRNVGKR